MSDQKFLFPEAGDHCGWHSFHVSLQVNLSACLPDSLHMFLSLGFCFKLLSPRAASVAALTRSWVAAPVHQVQPKATGNQFAVWSRRKKDCALHKAHKEVCTESPKRALHHGN